MGERLFAEEIMEHLEKIPVPERMIRSTSRPVFFEDNRDYAWVLQRQYVGKRSKDLIYLARKSGQGIEIVKQFEADGLLLGSSLEKPLAGTPKIGHVF